MSHFSSSQGKFIRIHFNTKGKLAGYTIFIFIGHLYDHPLLTIMTYIECRLIDNYKSVATLIERFFGRLQHWYKVPSWGIYFQLWHWDILAWEGSNHFPTRGGTQLPHLLPDDAGFHNNNDDIDVGWWWTTMMKIKWGLEEIKT